MARTRLFSRTTWALLAFTLAVVAWGGLVRASSSGDGCGANWPTCNGELFPKDSVPKRRIEFTHRVMSGTSVALVVAWGSWAFFLFPRRSGTRRAAGVAIGLIFVEALIGAAIVLLRLVGTDASLTRVVGMGLHLISTFLLLAALLLAGLWSAGTARPELRDQRPLAPLLLASLGALLLLAMTGAIAALGDTLFPARSLAAGLAADASPTASFLLRLRILHPFFAAGGAALLLATAAAAAALRPAPSVRRAAFAVAVTVCLQLLLGLLNLALLAPIGLQLLHLVLADGVWLSVVALGACALAADAPRAAVGLRDVARTLRPGAHPVRPKAGPSL